MRCEHAVVEDEVDSAPRRYGGQLFEKLQRLEEEMARAVSPGGLQREQDAAVVRPRVRERGLRRRE